MRCHTSLFVVLTVGWYITLSSGFRTLVQPPENYIENFPRDVENIENYDDEKLERMGSVLADILISPWPHGISPIIYVETNKIPEGDQIPFDNPESDEPFHPAPIKRTRYYRKYPWKRQNSRYEPGNRFICTPSKEDVYRLLVALHEARQGNRDRMVNFCNRKRPAYAIYTNIRFMGK